MRRNDVEEHRGPIVNMRREAMWLNHDPLGIGELRRFDFDLEIAEAIETESRTVVSIAGEELKDYETYNDFHGLGTSAEESLKDYAVPSFLEFGPAVDVCVITTLRRVPVFFADRGEPFYEGGVMVHRVLPGWRIAATGKPTLQENEEFVVWKNGVRTEAAERLSEILRQSVAGDVAGSRRKGNLRLSREKGILS